jgi:hypothetical protein
MDNWWLLGPVGLLGLSVAALLVARSARVLMVLLGVQYAAAAGVLNALLAPDFAVGSLALSTAALVDAALGLTVTAVLGATLWLLRPAVLRTLREAQMDDFALAAARRARRRAAQEAAQAPPNWGEMMLPLFATVLAGIAAGALTRLYPLGAGTIGDLSFYWPALAGLLLLTLARDVLRLGVALLVLLHSSGLLAGLLAGRFEPLAGGLLAIGTVVVALALAYIWAASAAYGGLWDEE